MMPAWVKDAFNRFFFAPQSPTPIAIFRICYGACVLATLLLLRADWLEWFGVHGWISLSTMAAIEPGLRLNIFTLLPQNDLWIQAFFWVFAGFSILLTIGFWTRLSSIAVFVCLASMQQRNLLITHGGDTFLRVAGFFLMFAPAGATLSVDHLLRVRRGLESEQAPPQSPWAQRMIQFELSLLYCISFWWKAKGHTWWDGSALYYITHLSEIQRFPIPAWINNPLILKLGSWFALGFELALGVLIWVRPLRYPLLLAGLIFHLCLEYAINIPMFQWDVLAAYVLFLDPEDLERWGRSARDRVWSAARRAFRARISAEPS